MLKKRIDFFDNCKFFLMLLVVVGHFFEPYTASSPICRSLFLFIYSFHMPAFFFLSGLFDGRNTPLSKRLHKALYYLVLYIVLKVTITLVRWPFVGRPSFSLLTEDGIPWFCLVLGVYTLLAGLLYKANVNLPTVLAVSVLLACFVGFDKSVGDYLCLSRVVVFFPFYLFGMTLGRERLTGALNKRWLRVCGLIVLAAFLLICILWVGRLYPLRKFFTGRNPFADSLRAYGPLIRLGCYALSAAVGFAFMLIVPQRGLGALTVFGQRTMQVYFWHRPVIYVLTYLHVSDTVMSLGIAGRLLWLILAIILTLVLSLRIFSFPSGYLQQRLRPKGPTEK